MAASAGVAPEAAVRCVELNVSAGLSRRRSRCCASACSVCAAIPERVQGESAASRILPLSAVDALCLAAAARLRPQSPVERVQRPCTSASHCDYLLLDVVTVIFSLSLYLHTRYLAWCEVDTVQRIVQGGPTATANPGSPAEARSAALRSLFFLRIAGGPSSLHKVPVGFSAPSLSGRRS